jgi:hypothetical protein
MTNYEKMRDEYLKDPKFVKAYKEASLERNIANAIEELEMKIRNENLSNDKIIQILEIFRMEIFQGKYV